MASKLCPADAVLATNEENKQVLTAMANTECPDIVGPTITSTEAVTLERKVEIKVRLTYFSLSTFWMLTDRATVNIILLIKFR